MSASDYIIDLLLIALVLRQIRPKLLTARSVILPGVLVVLAGQQYLKGFPTAGNDLLLIVILVVLGAVFGVVSGFATKVWVDSQTGVMCRAGVLAATIWVLGMGIRFGFDLWAHTSSGTRRLITFSVHHSITTANAYSTAFVLMAFAQVVLRVGILQFRRVQLEGSAAGPELA